MTWPEASLLAFLLVVGVLLLAELYATRAEQTRWRALDEALTRRMQEMERTDDLARRAGL